jgi:hypothetical protein
MPSADSRRLLVHSLPAPVRSVTFPVLVNLVERERASNSLSWIGPPLGALRPIGWAQRPFFVLVAGDENQDESVLVSNIPEPD